MRILFQGDSITDASRDRSDFYGIGTGYAKYAADLIQEKYPDKEFEFINRGIGGNRTIDLVNRWDAECVELQPDIVSIMIGINDTWHYYSKHQNQVCTEEYEANYRKLLTAIKEKTKAKIIIIEPFLLTVPDKDFREDLNPKIDIARKLAAEFADALIPIDGLLAAACVHKEPTYWAGDGVHLTQEGAKFVAMHYLEAISPLIEE